MLTGEIVTSQGEKQRAVLSHQYKQEKRQIKSLTLAVYDVLYAVDVCYFASVCVR